MATPEPDYITILPTMKPDRFLTVIMKWHAPGNQWVQALVAGPYKMSQAQALAGLWSDVKKLEIR